jgi:outer membrane protein
MRSLAGALVLVVGLAGAAHAEGTYEKLTLTQAVERALSRNVATTVARQEVDRADALVREARAPSLPTLTASGQYLRLDGDRKLGESVLASKNQLSANLNLTVPLFVPQKWTAWSHARTNLDTALASSEDMRRTIALATARAYLAIIAQKRVVDVGERALATDQAHATCAHTRLSGGVGNRVDDVRAAQQVASDQAQLSNAITALGRAREALGILIGAELPADTMDDVALPSGSTNAVQALERRRDVAAARQRVRAAEEIKKDGWADYAPTLVGQAQPFYQNPASLTTPETGWQAMLVLAVPLYDGGLRYGLARERAVLFAEAQANYEGLARQTRSEIRVAVLEIEKADEALASASRAAKLAHQALDLANLAYQAGATTNLEVVDAERRATDADTAAVIAEDTVRQARLDLLAAAGQFP